MSGKASLRNDLKPGVGRTIFPIARETIVEVEPEDGKKNRARNMLPELKKHTVLKLTSFFSGE